MFLKLKRTCFAEQNWTGTLLACCVLDKKCTKHQSYSPNTEEVIWWNEFEHSNPTVSCTKSLSRTFFGILSCLWPKRRGIFPYWNSLCQRLKRERLSNFGWIEFFENIGKSQSCTLKTLVETDLSKNNSLLPATNTDNEWWCFSLTLVWDQSSVYKHLRKRLAVPPRMKLCSTRIQQKTVVKILQSLEFWLIYAWSSALYQTVVIFSMRGPLSMTWFILLMRRRSWLT